MSEMRDLEELQEQAEVEKIYREAVETLHLIVIAYAGSAEGEHPIQALVREHPGSNVYFWYGLIRMAVEALSEDRLVPQAGGDG